MTLLDLQGIDGGVINSNNNNGAFDFSNPFYTSTVDYDTVPVVGTLPDPFDFSDLITGPTVNVNGVVVDSYGDPVPQANVYLKNNSSAGVYTDFDGNYDLGEVAAQDQVVVSHASYPTRTFYAAVMPSTVSMAASNLLDEIVVQADPPPVTDTPLVKTNTIVYVVIAILAAAAIAVFAIKTTSPKAITV